MPKGKKKFIDKKNSVTFHLVHRSQQDPLIADEDAPQRVLVEQASKAKPNKEEEAKYGIYFEDDYNYLQHLRDTSKQSVHWEPVENPNNSNPSVKVLKQKTKQKDDGSDEEEEVYRVEPQLKQFKLPSSVFASEVEEEVGLLNKAAPSGLRLDWDPDIVAAMDEDFDYDDPDNELEDNFFELANAESGSRSDDENDESGSEFVDSDDEDMEVNSEERDEVGSLHAFDDEETKSRFTEYSMSSSVIRRNQQLTMLDDRFEKMFEAYDDNEIGPLDCEEIEGFMPTNSQMLLQCADDFEKQQKTQMATENAEKPNLDLLSDTDSESDLRDFEVKDEEDEKWDCQSILSTYSNIYNRPKVISERKENGKIRISSKTGIPLGVFDSGNQKLTAKALAKLNETETGRQSEEAGGRAESVISTLSTLSIRPKGETSEERKDRKRALKIYRKERVLERKANTEAFKEEKKRQEKIRLNNKKNFPTVHMM